MLVSPSPQKIKVLGKAKHEFCSPVLRVSANTSISGNGSRNYFMLHGFVPTKTGSLRDSHSAMMRNEFVVTVVVNATMCTSSGTRLLMSPILEKATRNSSPVRN